MKRLDGKRVLLVAPRFFGYESEIRSELERRGAIVDWLPDRPFDTPIMKALTRLRPGWILPFADRLYARLLEGFAAPRYDIVLAINGQTLSRSTLTQLRTTFPRGRFVLYLWDSIENRKHVRLNLPKFDHVCTFDPNDAARYGIPLRPLFFGGGFLTATVSPLAPIKYDISFVGTAHTDRYQVINTLRKNLPAKCVAYWYLYLQARWVFQYYRWRQPGMRNAQAGDFHFVPLDKGTVQSVFAESRAVLDIEHAHQSGLTMRTFETLGSGKKLVTTNAQVRDYDFYSDDNICIIDRAAPSVPEEFLSTPFRPLPAAFRARYSIEGWVDEVLELQQ